MVGETKETLMVELLQQNSNVLLQLGIVQANLAIMLDDRGRATEGRKAIYDKIEDVRDRLAAIESLPVRVSKLEASHDKIDARVDQLESKYDHASGAVWMFRFMWVGLGAVFIAVLNWLTKKFGGF